MLQPIETIKTQIEQAIPGARLEIIPNETGAQPSLLVNRESTLATAQFLRDDPAFQMDYASNVTGVDWLDTVLKEKVKVRKVIDGEEKEVEETIETKRPGYLEVVYHLYSMAAKHGPLIIRVRTADRGENVRVPSLTPVWRGAELQEREIYDLYGVHFEGHPDLRRLLMWEGFAHHPMRKDYHEPDDFEYEPTPHDDVLDRARTHYPAGPED